MTQEEKMNFCQIIGTLLVSDLQLSDAEVAYLENLYQRLGITPSEREEVESCIDLQADLKAVARGLSPMARQELIYEINRAAWADGVLVKPEMRIIREIESVLDEG